MCVVCVSVEVLECVVQAVCVSVEVLVCVVQAVCVMCVSVRGCLSDQSRLGVCGMRVCMCAGYHVTFPGSVGAVSLPQSGAQCHGFRAIGYTAG